MSDLELNRCEIGDCRAILPTLPAETFACCVTSPPYWGLRDYGTARWDDGDAGCDHRGPPMRTNSKPSDPSATFHGGQSRAHEFYREVCGRCGARRVDSQLGLEPTPEEYVANMVAVFREVRRVLRDDGTLWLNLGDSYSMSTRGKGGDGKQSTNVGTHHDRQWQIAPGLKPKDLVGIPWRVAFALQADGWYLRSDIVWSKPNPMPESVTDRPTKAHEYVFLLSKRPRYHFDADAVAEPEAETSKRLRKYDKHWTERPGNGEGDCDGRPWRMGGAAGGLRNVRSVWAIATEPYSGSHFAVMPTALVTRCILAGAPLGGAVLDPFFGSGTVGNVAESLGRRWFGCELNPEYGKLIRERTAQMGLVFG